ncbi:hypothetical protein FRB99_004191 [Tulasnella sp. 403]|nr:hypothetical protein FRB99_004191 [Tulasnella sp. 403]
MATAANYLWPTSADGEANLEANDLPPDLVSSIHNGPSHQRSKSTNSPELASSSSRPIEWTTFRGNPNESISAFIQTIQRVALSQGMQNNSAWVAAYTASCFADGALGWFSSLDNEVQTSWTRLRPALLERYPIRFPAFSSESAPIPAAASAALPNPLGAAQVDGLKTRPAAPPRRVEVSTQDLSSPRRGYIQLVECITGQFQGYLSKRSGIVSTRLQTDALIVELPSNPSSSDPFRIRMENYVSDTSTDPKHKCLGLRKIEEWTSSTKSWVLCPCTGDPPLGKDKIAQGRRASVINYPDRYCASSAVWTVHPIGPVVELKLLWTKDYGSGCTPLAPKVKD